jgi:hypothetical protein
LNRDFATSTEIGFWRRGMELNFRMPLSRLNAGIASSDKIDGYFEGFLGIVSYNKIGRNTKPLGIVAGIPLIKLLKLAGKISHIGIFGSTAGGLITKVIGSRYSLLCPMRLPETEKRPLVPQNERRGPLRGGGRLGHVISLHGTCNLIC